MRSCDVPDFVTSDFFLQIFGHLKSPGVLPDDALSWVLEAEEEYWSECARGNYGHTSTVLPKYEHKIPSSWKYLYEKHLPTHAAAYNSRLRKRPHPDDLCAYCEKNDAGTLDHYIPKSKNPLLSVSPANLVPACGPCNEKLDRTGKKFHPYFDVVDFKWLSVTSTYFQKEPGMHFCVSCPAGTDGSLVERIEHTFRESQMGQRWISEVINASVSALKVALPGTHPSVPSAQIRANFVKEWQPANHPERVLFEHIFDSEWFDDWRAHNAPRGDWRSAI